MSDSATDDETDDASVHDNPGVPKDRERDPTENVVAPMETTVRVTFQGMTDEYGRAAVLRMLEDHSSVASVQRVDTPTIPDVDTEYIDREDDRLGPFMAARPMPRGVRVTTKEGNLVQALSLTEDDLLTLLGLYR